MPTYEKNGKYKANKELTDTEIIPFSQDNNEYMQKEVLPFAPNSYIVENKTKIGYEIPFTRYFYEYKPPRKTEDILEEILALDKELDGVLKELQND